MLGIIIIYWIGRKYYDLAVRCNKSPWSWAIYAILIFYGSQIMFGVLVALFSPETNFETNEVILNILGIAISGIVWFSVYKLLEKRWEKIDPNTYEDLIDNIGKETN